MFNELEDLLQLTKCFEAVAPTPEEKEEDLGATYVDFGDGNTDPHAEADVIKVRSRNDSDDETKTPVKKPLPEKHEESTESDDIHAEVKGAKRVGGSGNVVVKNDKNSSPLFEQKPGEDEANMAPPEEEGLFSGIKRGFGIDECIEDGMGRNFVRKYQLECCGQCAGNDGFGLGQVVQCDGAPVLFLVKNNDGHALTLAKPTRNEDEYCNSREGKWPEFTYEANTIKPMLNVSIDDITKILDFNDRDLQSDNASDSKSDIKTGFNGRTIDESPMKIAQQGAIDNSFDRIADKLNEILGMSYHDACTGKNKDYCYTDISPKVVIQNPDGSVTTKQNMGGYRIKFGD